MLIYKSKNILIFVLIFFVSLIILGAYLLNGFVFINKNNINSELILISDGPCSIREQGSVLSESVSLFLQSSFNDNDNGNVERSKKLFDLEQKIINQENYDKDANCLHILTMVFIERGDVLQSEKHLDLLIKGLRENNPESYILDENVNFKTQEEMQLSIDAIKYNVQKAIENDPFKNQNRLDEKIE
jgi:hypothetical protein